MVQTKGRALCCIVLLAIAALVSPRQVVAEVQWEPYLDWGGQVFPSFIIATHGIDFTEEIDDPNVIGDTGSVFGATIIAPNDGAKVKLEVQCEGYARPSSIEATLETAGVEYGLLPIMLWDFDKLRKSDQARPLIITFNLLVDGVAVDTRHVKAFLRSVNDCPYFIIDEENEEALSTSFMFAAYVNEDHPWIDEMLRVSLDYGVVESFSGYQSGDQEQVLLQVFSIWKALRNEGIQYSNITQAVGSAKAVRSQEVRFLDQSIGNAQANCVDGSVLIASFLRKIDIEAALVLVPGHCYLAFALDSEGETLLGLETTMMGNGNIDPEAVAAALPEDFEAPEELAEDEDFVNFLAAVLAGTQNLAENAEAFEDPENPDYELIALHEARALGIMPIYHMD